MLFVAFLQLVCAVYVQLYRLAAEYGNTQRGGIGVRGACESKAAVDRQNPHSPTRSPPTILFSLFPSPPVLRSRCFQPPRKH